MKTATVRQLRHHFGNVLAWVEEGESVQISKRGQVVALVLPPPPRRHSKRKQRPDFAARLKRLYGAKILPGNMVTEDRESRNF